MNTLLKEERFKLISGFVIITVLLFVVLAVIGIFRSPSTKFLSSTMLRSSFLPFIRDQREYDVVVYGSSSSGLIAAYQIARMGKTVAVISPIPRIGGMTTNGLSKVDVGKASSIGGLTLEYFTRISHKYGHIGPSWAVEPKIALQVFQEMMAEKNIPIFYDKLKLSDGVVKTGATIDTITMESGDVFKAKIFIDASYEGDLMAEAGVSYTIGRESNTTYGEQFNGIRDMTLPTFGIDPYVIKGDPSSGLLPRVNPDSGGKTGTGDQKVQAYNYRMILTNVVSNRVMIARPDGYNEADYEILFRAIERGQSLFFTMKYWLLNGKIDANNSAGVSTDYVGMSYNYAEADYKTREQINKAHEYWQKGLVYTLQHLQDVKLPDGSNRFDITKGNAKVVYDLYKDWGLPLDEFTENGNWPLQLYVRESRRMVSDFIMTEKEVRKQNPVEDPIGMGSFDLDSHCVQYFVNTEGYVQCEGGINNEIKGLYPISYRAIVPKDTEANNLYVLVTFSASHSAYSSLRMEPVHMILGQSAGTAAVIAIEDRVTVQQVDFEKLYNRLLADKQVLPPLPSTSIEN